MRPTQSPSDFSNRDSGTEEHRKWGPTMVPERWHEHLVRAGFSGVDTGLSSTEDPRYRLGSAMLSTVPSTYQGLPERQNSIIVREDSSSFQCAVAHQVEHYLRSQGQRFPFNNFTYCLTLFPKCFSSFDYSTCALSYRYSRISLYLYAIDRISTAIYSYY